MYLVTEEDTEDGMWFGEPRGFESEDQARKAVLMTKPPTPGHSYVLYRCDEIETLKTTDR